MPVVEAGEVLREDARVSTWRISDSIWLLDIRGMLPASANQDGVVGTTEKVIVSREMPAGRGEAGPSTRHRAWAES